MKKIILLFLCVISIVGVAAEPAATQPQIIPSYNMQQYDREISHIYSSVLHSANQNLTQRIDMASQFFLGRPYFLGPLGEGPNGDFDQMPLYRTDKFDCTTYVETVLALARANNLDEFKTSIKKIRYRNGQVKFIARNHFTEIDWNVNNTQQGFVKDITGDLGASVKIAHALINKPAWYRTLPADNIELLNSDKRSAQALVKAFRDNAKKVSAQVSNITYLPFSELFHIEQNHLVANQEVFNRIPSGSIIEIVRNNYDLTDKIGTHLNVTHMGFAIWKNQQLIFRQASEIRKQVIDVPLINYLAWFYQYIDDPTQVGIHVEQPVQK